MRNTGMRKFWHDESDAQTTHGPSSLPMHIGFPPAFVPYRRSTGSLGDPHARLIRLGTSGKKKTVCATCGTAHWGWYDRRQRAGPEILSLRKTTAFYLDPWRCVVSLPSVRHREGASGWRVFSCKTRCTHRALCPLYVGQRCRSGTIKDVAEELNLGLAHGQATREAIHATGS